MLRRCTSLFASPAVAAEISNKLKIVECPRDAIQGIETFIPTEEKVRYLKSLLACGYDTLDCVSFVPAKVMPQLADSEEVLNQIGLELTTGLRTNGQQQQMPLTADAAATASALKGSNGRSSSMRRQPPKLLAVVANLRGAQIACASPHISTVGYPLSASETFQQRNTRRSIKEALDDIAEIQKLCAASKNKQLGVCISMAFGNPYGEKVTGADVGALSERLFDMGVPVIYFADTVGSGTAEYIAEVYQQATTAVLEKQARLHEAEGKCETKRGHVEFGIHLHSTPVDAEKKLKALMEAGCRRFDGALLGLGGCPFAQDKLVGNIPSETIVKVANEMGLDHGVCTERQHEARHVLNHILSRLESSDKERG